MADEEPKKKSKMKWIILLMLILALGAGAGVVWKMGMLDMILGGEKDKETAETETAMPSKPASAGKLVALPEFRVNLSDPLGKRFILLQLEIDLTSEQAAKELEAHKAAVKDSIILLLSSKSYAELSSVESKLLLKSEVVERINQILGGSKVAQVYITNMIIQ